MKAPADTATEQRAERGADASEPRPTFRRGQVRQVLQPQVAKDGLEECTRGWEQL